MLTRTGFMWFNTSFTQVKKKGKKAPAAVTVNLTASHGEENPHSFYPHLSEPSLYFSSRQGTANTPSECFLLFIGSCCQGFFFFFLVSPHDRVKCFNFPPVCSKWVQKTCTSIGYQTRPTRRRSALQIWTLKVVHVSVKMEKKGMLSQLEKREVTLALCHETETWCVH